MLNSEYKVSTFFSIQSFQIRFKIEMIFNRIRRGVGKCFRFVMSPVSAQVKWNLNRIDQFDL